MGPMYARKLRNSLSKPRKTLLASEASTLVRVQCQTDSRHISPSLAQAEFSLDNLPRFLDDDCLDDDVLADDFLMENCLDRHVLNEAYLIPVVTWPRLERVSNMVMLALWTYGACAILS